MLTFKSSFLQTFLEGGAVGIVRHFPYDSRNTLKTPKQTTHALVSKQAPARCINHIYTQRGILPGGGAHTYVDTVKGLNQAEQIKP